MPHSSAMADAKVEVVRLASGAAANDAIISGSIDVAMAGLTVMLNLRDKTAGARAGQGHDGHRRQPDLLQHDRSAHQVGEGLPATPTALP